MDWYIPVRKFLEYFIQIPPALDDQPKSFDKGHMLSQSNQPWRLRTSAGHEESYYYRTILLPGPASSVSGSVINEDESRCVDLEEQEGDESGIRTGEKNLSVVSTLISTFRLPRFLALVSSISTSPPVIGDPSHVIKITPNKGFGMFARRDIKKGELIVWERPAVIVPGLERNEDTSQAYQLLAEEFLELDGTNVEGAIQLGSMKEIRATGKEVYGDIRKMAISSSFDVGHWLEGVVRTNALVFEFENGQRKSRQEEQEIYGGVYPLINRCNHRLVQVVFGENCN